jgi:hypothetical protein
MNQLCISTKLREKLGWLAVLYQGTIFDNRYLVIRGHILESMHDSNDCRVSEFCVDNVLNLSLVLRVQAKICLGFL